MYSTVSDWQVSDITTPPSVLLFLLPFLPGLPRTSQKSNVTIRGVYRLLMVSLQEERDFLHSFPVVNQGQSFLHLDSHLQNKMIYVKKHFIQSLLQNWLKGKISWCQSSEGTYLLPIFIPVSSGFSETTDSILIVLIICCMDDILCELVILTSN